MGLSIPAFHVSGRSRRVEGKGVVFIDSRAGGGASGTFEININAKFDPPTTPYPTGVFDLKVSLNDGVQGNFRATSIELINSHGRANPTVFLTGQCEGKAAGLERRKGLRYWLMIANNQPKRPRKDATPDVVGFAIHDNIGARVAYGTGPVKSGQFLVQAE